jgi:hypothetical protein
MKKPTRPPTCSEIGPTSGLLTRSLESFRGYIGHVEAHALINVATFVVEHTIETLRRAGLGDAARRLLVAELDELALAMTHRAVRNSVTTDDLPIGAQGTANDDAKIVPFPARLQVIEGGRAQ